MSTSIAAASVERAWTSRPANVIVPVMAGPSLRYMGEPEQVSGQTNSICNQRVRPSNGRDY